MFSRKTIPYLLATLSIGLLLYSCANRGYPVGGPKDEDPPVIVKEDPVNGGLNFDKKKLNIYFNEYVQLKEVSSKFIISPPQKKQPKVKLRGKRVLVEFADTLRENTTYSLDFGTSIVDNNEGIPMGHYRYYFSTGDHIDTLRVGGNVYDSYTSKPVENAYVMLYDATIADSVPLKDVPMYVARTDTAGYFSITNIKQHKYKLMAIEDGNKNSIFDSPTERVAFSDSIVFPTVYDLTRRDTSSQDSTAIVSYTAFGPENLKLHMFQEKERIQYLVNSERKERGCIDFDFSIPRTDSLKVDLFGIDNEMDVFVVERNQTNDTLKYWIKDTMVYNRDTLRAELRYLKTDTLGMLVETRDTVDFDFEDEEFIVEDSKKDKKKEKKIDFLKMDFNLSSSVNPNSVLKFNVDQPVLEDLSDKINLYKFENDTVKVKQDIKIHRDSLKIRNYTIDYKWQPGVKYSLEADSASIHSVSGKFNDKIENKLSVKEVEEYGTVILSLKNGKYPMILKLLKVGGKEYSEVREIYPTKDGEYVIKYVNPGKYSFMAVSDANGNKKWDTGYYIKHIQPEKVIYINKEVEIRENWDFELEWDFSDRKEVEDIE